MAQTPEERIHILWAKEEIRGLALRFCRAADRGDMDMMESVFHPGAKDEHGFNKTNTAREFIDICPTLQASMEILQHNVTNHLIDVDDDKAEGEVYIVVYHRFPGENGPVLLVTGGRYLDKYELRDGEWKISHRKCIDDWSVQFPAPETAQNSFTEDALPHGQIGPDDISYSFFKRLPRVGL